jgi:hypothetical protein
MDLFTNRILSNKVKLKIKVFNENKISNSKNKKFPSLRPSSSKYILKKKSHSFGKNINENFENKNNQIIEIIKKDYEKENKELKLKLEILQKEIINLKQENDDLKRKYEEYIPTNKKKKLLIQNKKVKFNSFHSFYSINSTIIKNDSKISSEQNRKTEIKKSFEKNITLFNSDENNFDINTKFKLVKNRKIPSFDKSIKSYSNINEIINCFNQNSIIKMEFIKKRIMNLLNNYNILIENFAK